MQGPLNTVACTTDVRESDLLYPIMTIQIEHFFKISAKWVLVLDRKMNLDKPIRWQAIVSAAFAYWNLYNACKLWVAHTTFMGSVVDIVSLVNAFEKWMSL